MCAISLSLPEIPHAEQPGLWADVPMSVSIRLGPGLDPQPASLAARPAGHPLVRASRPVRGGAVDPLSEQASVPDAALCDFLHRIEQHLTRKV